MRNQDWFSREESKKAKLALWEEFEEERKNAAEEEGFKPSSLLNQRGGWVQQGGQVFSGLFVNRDSCLTKPRFIS